MDPISIAATVALLAGKKVVEKIGDKAGDAGWGLGNKILDKVRGWFSVTDKVATKQLEAVEEATDPTEEQVSELAALITERLKAAPTIADELAPMVEAAHNDAELAPLLTTSDSVVAASTVINQSASGTGHIQVGQAGGDVNIDTTGTPKSS